MNYGERGEDVWFYPRSDHPPTSTSRRCPKCGQWVEADADTMCWDEFLESAKA